MDKIKTVKPDRCVSILSGTSSGVHPLPYEPYVRQYDFSELEEMVAALVAQNLPQVGSQWLHKKGNKYTVVMLTNMLGERNDPDFPPTVVYKGEDGRIWSRPLSRWHGNFTPIPFDVENIDPKDLKFDTYRPRSGHIAVTDTSVRVTHLPSGVYAECCEHRSQFRNKNVAFEQLKQKLKELYM